MKNITKKDIILLAVVVVLVVFGLVLFTSEQVEAPTGDADDTGENGDICAQVITPARNPETGEVVEFPTPCDVPDGWGVIR